MGIRFILLIFANILVISSFSQQKELWGAAPYSGYGVIYKLDTNGTAYETKFEFEKVGPDYLDFGRLCETVNGTFFGMSDNGKFFKYELSTKEIEVVFELKDTIDGRKPKGTMLYATNGLLYGMTKNGGLYDLGVIFSFDPTTYEYTKLLDFNDINGANPDGSLIQAKNGKLYGMTFGGGSAMVKEGVLFEYNISSDVYTNLHNFSYATGRRPKGSLLQASNGRLYGVTTSSIGGNNFFEFNLKNSSYTNISPNFNVTTGIVESALIEATNGYIYGVSSSGGPSSGDKGTIFRFSSDTNIVPTISVEYSFNYGSTTSHGTPVGQLIQAGNYLFGYAKQIKGRNRPGLFRFHTVFGSLTVLTGEFGRRHTSGGLVKASNGEVIGVSSVNSQGSDGNIFELNTVTREITNTALLGRRNGENPRGGLLYASNGLIYGTTIQGGENEQGTLFSYNPSNDKYENLIDFEDTISGKSPVGTLIQASNDKIYGITEKGGTDGRGVLFEYNVTTKDITKLVDFDSLNGHTPQRGVMQASNGKLYGTTSLGGTYHEGVLYEYDILTDTYTKKRDFYWFDGANPIGTPVEIGNGILYGTTENRGKSSTVGTLYKYDLNTNTFTKLKDFNSTALGGNPRASLIKASDDSLYGATITGAQNGEGAIFKYKISTDTLTKEKDFAFSIGTDVEYQFKRNDEGCYYLTSRNGGKSNRGTIQLFCPDSNKLTAFAEFGNYSGAFYPYGALLELEVCRTARISSISVSNSILCLGDSSIIEVGSLDSLYDAAQWSLYADSCGGVPIQSNLTGRFIVKPNRSVQYFVRGDGGCILPSTNCESVSITVVPLYNLFDTLTVCNGDSFMFPDSTILTNINADTTHISKLKTVLGGCDSLINTTLIFNPNNSYSIYDTVAVCYNSTYNFPDGSVISGLLVDTTQISYLQTKYTACDSIVNTTVQINSIDTTILAADTVCYLGQFLLPDSTFIKSLTTDTSVNTILKKRTNACDSVVISAIKVYKADTSVQLSGRTLISNAENVNYQWIDCNADTAIIGAIAKTYRITQQGSYAVEIRRRDCIDTSACLKVVLTSLNNQDSHRGKFSIHPNPTKGSLIITSGESSTWLNVSLFNVHGQEIRSTQVSNNSSNEFEITETAGIYFLLITNQKGENSYFKIIKQ